ncbi:MAG: hypothetical protein KDE20_16795 [Caldilineaceae bacterium]|nr:hypothetical protein [Caldilineaceae bacterium]
MTLIVSLRIPDGIVIAGDSLATMIQQARYQAEVEVDCPHCEQQHKAYVPIEIPAPGATLSYAQKVFPFQGRYGIGTHGVGMLVGKSIYFAIRQFEVVGDFEPPASVEEAARLLANYMHNLLKSQVEHDGANLSDFPSNWSPLGFQVVGYRDDQPVTVLVNIGREISISAEDTLGCTVSGQFELVQAIWGTYDKDSSQKPPYHLFSLQDAIAYAEFLIGTTAQHQRFSSRAPSVGGDIDVALVTPFNGFQWIRQKEIGRILEGAT